MEGGKKGQGRAEEANIVVPARCKVTWPTVGSLGKQDRDGFNVQSEGKKEVKNDSYFGEAWFM